MTKICSTAVALLMPFYVLADPPKEVMDIHREGELKFVQSKMNPGISQAVIAGNASEAGEVYVVRNRFSPGTFSAPHFHPETRYIAVLKGTWWVGSGPVFDKDKTTPVPAGSFVVHHPNQIHWDGAKDEEAVVQIMGVGPSATIRVDPAGRPQQ
jgi:quercetin dioxygenase-like cupin family protein